MKIIIPLLLLLLCSCSKCPQAQCNVEITYQNDSREVISTICVSSCNHSNVPSLNDKGCLWIINKETETYEYNKCGVRTFKIIK